MSASRRWFTRTAGTSLVPLADAWVAHSILSNSSHVLNDECAAMLRVAPPDNALPDDVLCQLLADDFDESAAHVAAAVASVWDRLVDAGLLTEHPPAVAP